MIKHVINNNISVDCVIFGFDFENLKVLLVERTLLDSETGEVRFSDKTLTGNHIFEHETLDEAANRVLFELTGLDNIYMEQFKTFASPERLKRPNDQEWLIANGRDPEQRIASVGFYSLLATQDVKLEWKGRNVNWYPVQDIEDLAFDHKQILDDALVALRHKLMYEPVGFELLPEKFTLTQLQSLYEVVLGIEMDKRNFRKKVARMKYLIPLDEKQKGVAHKPARLYMFSKDVYEKTRKEMLGFSI